MVFTSAILELQAALHEAGYTVDETCAESSGWLAYLSARDGSFKNCHSNQRPPALCITADDIPLNDVSYKAATFSIRGQADDSDNSWMQIQVYSVPFKTPADVFAAIPHATDLCRAAWNAAVSVSSK